MTESLLWTKNFVKINFQISQNDTVWSNIAFPFSNDMYKWQIMNFRPKCAILADLEINLPQNLSFNAALHTLIELYMISWFYQISLVHV